MSRAIRLKTYKQALKDWSNPVNDDTQFGFCQYFEYKGYFSYHHDFPELYAKGDVQKIGHYHYDGSGRIEKGRLQRVNALKEVISEMELEVGSN